MTPLGPARLVATLGVLLFGLVLSIGTGLLCGPSPLGVGEALRILLAGGEDSAAADIVLRIRLPRVALAILVGASLSVAGVLFQALLRNPLADPYILGVSGGAALGGILVLGLGSSLGLGYAAVPPAAFAGSLVTLALLYGVVGASGRFEPSRLLLTGVVFNAFASAAIVFTASLAGLVEGTRIFLWLIGNLSAARTDVLAPVAVFLVLGLGCAIPLARGLNVLTLGEESALQLGVDVSWLRRILLVATSLMVGAAVAVAGLVGFVGLIVPHLLRLVLGPDHRLLIPAAALAGAAFLVLCDVAARTLLPGRELPVGAITALAGGPLFLVLLHRQGQRGAS
ncbi:MAG: iron ABC transporter permease [Myxococcota bacterium]